jgi:Glycosyltransferase family 87
MSFLFKDFNIANKKIPFANFLWFSLAIIAAIIQLIKSPAVGIHNYLIFKGVFWHTIEQVNLYGLYPLEYGDCNHYGPVFSLIIAPFALLPNVIGCFLWCILNAGILFYAVQKLPISTKNKQLVLLIGAIEMMTAIHNVQFNPMLTAWIILSYVLVIQQKDFWATLFIAAGLLTKLYGIVGLAFFLFSSNKKTFILSFLFWMAVLFALPMLISSPTFIIQSYKDWYNVLVEKNATNIESNMQGMSVMRLIKKFLHIKNLPDIYVLATAAICYLLPFIRFKYFKNVHFQLKYLAFLLIGVVIFSSSAEAATFVIAMMGVGVWFITVENKKPLIYGLLFFAIVFTSLSTTDLFPSSIKFKYVRPYALKALPCFFIWLALFYELLIKKFTPKMEIL